MKIVKLIYDKYENDYGFYDYPEEEKDEEEIKSNILKKLPKSIDFQLIDKEREMQIYSWGIKKNSGVECDIVFDLTNFQSKLDDNLDVKELNGLSNEIQDSIILHPKFSELIVKVVSLVEINKPTKIGFFCNHGKHRSVGWAEIVKKYYYHNANIRHLTLDY